MAAKRVTHLSDAVLGVLARVEIKGQNVYLPGQVGQLQRDLYVDVNKALEALGGKWNKKAKAHVFEEGRDPAVEIPGALGAGTVTTAAGLAFFPTPEDIAREVVKAAAVKPGMRVLEPSAGEGALLRAVLAAAPTAELTGVEVDRRRHVSLLLGFHGHTMIGGDFLSLHPHSMPPFDRVIMNPPFSLEGQPQADIDHVEHALRFCKGGGRVVAIMSGGTLYRDNRQAVAFRAMVDKREGSMWELPDGAFKVSGTGVKTVLAVVPT